MQFSIYSKVLSPHVFTVQCSLLAQKWKSMSFDRISPARTLSSVSRRFNRASRQQFSCGIGYFCALFIEYCDYLYSIYDSSKTNSSELKKHQASAICMLFFVCACACLFVWCAMPAYSFIYTKGAINDNKEKFELSTKPKTKYAQRKWERWRSE